MGNVPTLVSNGTILDILELCKANTFSKSYFISYFIIPSFSLDLLIPILSCDRLFGFRKTGDLLLKDQLLEKVFLVPCLRCLGTALHTLPLKQSSSRCGSLSLPNVPQVL